MTPRCAGRGENYSPAYLRLNSLGARLYCMRGSAIRAERMRRHGADAYRALREHAQPGAGYRGPLQGGHGHRGASAATHVLLRPQQLTVYTQSIVLTLDRSRSATSRTHTTSSAPAPVLSTTSVSSVPPAVVPPSDEPPLALLELLEPEPVRLPRLRLPILPASERAGAETWGGAGSERFDAALRLDWVELMLTLSLALPEMDSDDDARALFAASAALAAAGVM